MHRFEAWEPHLNGAYCIWHFDTEEQAQDYCDRHLNKGHVHPAEYYPLNENPANKDS